MDVLATEIRRPDGYATDVARVLVNGHDLIELARAVELPWATADGQSSLAGSYEALGAEEVLAPSRHLLDRPAPDLQVTSDGRVALLACVCGEAGCWPLAARITVTAEQVTWSDFIQPHRPHWRYDALGPFAFARSQYEEALGFRSRITTP